MCSSPHALLLPYGNEQLVGFGRMSVSPYHFSFTNLHQVYFGTLSCILLFQHSSYTYLLTVHLAHSGWWETDACPFHHVGVCG